MRRTFFFAVFALTAVAGLIRAQRNLPAGVRLSQPATTGQQEASARAYVRTALARRGLSNVSWALRRNGTLRFAAGFPIETHPGEPEAAALAFLGEYADLFSGPQLHFEVASVKTVGDYSLVRLQQAVEGVPVYGKDLVFTLDQQNAVRLVSANYEPVRSARKARVVGGEVAAARAVQAQVGGNRRAIGTHQVWFAENGILTPAWQVTVEDQEANGFPAHWSYVVSADTGDVLESHDLRLGQSRQAGGFVYPTNPLASDVVSVTLGNLANGVSLAGANAKVYSNLNVLLGLSAPGNYTALAMADSSGNYPYKPWDPRHAEVQLYWAMDRAAQNFKAVGYPGLGRALEGVTEFADCSSDGCAAQNNAFFNPQGFSGRGGLYIYYCRSGEVTYDTGIMFHEFTHAVVNDLVGPNQGSTFRALNEGTADYFASSFMEDAVFAPYAAMIWGMRTPYLRTPSNQNLYPRNLVGEAHLDGNIWSGALWDLRKTLGGARADTAVLLTIASISSSAEFYDAATAAVNVTALLYGHPAGAAAEKIFVSRGLLSAPAEFGADPHFLRAGALPVVDSIGPGTAASGVLADRQFRFFVPPSATSFALRLQGNSNRLVALLKHRSPVVVYDDGTTNADYISDITSQITFNVNESSDPEIQAGDYYLWVGHFNTQSSTEYAVFLDMQARSYSLTDFRFAEVIPNGSPVFGSMPNGPILNAREFLVRVPDGATALGLKVEGETDMDLYVKYGAPVFYNNQGFPEADVVRGSSSSSEVAILTRYTVPSLTPGTYAVGVYNADDTYPSHFKVTAVTLSDSASGPKLAGFAARTPVSMQFPGAFGAAILADTEYAIDVPAGSAGLHLSVTTDLDAQVYIRQGSAITFSKGWPVSDFSFKTRDRKSFDVTAASAMPLKPGRYYVWVANASDTAGQALLTYTLY
ncbi:MAG: hypothetical protein C5B51_20345 [Terriglobia bacterium]|nr:MAG: hypothetical protein C5B51_20345 [Terriglobia bacterium]